MCPWVQYVSEVGIISEGARRWKQVTNRGWLIMNGEDSNRPRDKHCHSRALARMQARVSLDSPSSRVCHLISFRFAERLPRYHLEPCVSLKSLPHNSCQFVIVEPVSFPSPFNLTEQDKLCKVCYECDTPFTMFRRRHHCRVCGQIFCNNCSSNRVDGRPLGINGELWHPWTIKA